MDDINGCYLVWYDGGFLVRWKEFLVRWTAFLSTTALGLDTKDSTPTRLSPRRGPPAMTLGQYLASQLSTGETSGGRHCVPGVGVRWGRGTGFGLCANGFRRKARAIVRSGTGCEGFGRRGWLGGREKWAAQDHEPTPDYVRYFVPVLSIKGGRFPAVPAARGTSGDCRKVLAFVQ